MINDYSQCLYNVKVLLQIKLTTISLKKVFTQVYT